MNHIIGHFSGMLPYMALIMPFHVLVRLVILRRRHQKINRYHESALLVFVAFLAGLASQTVIPRFDWGAEGIVPYGGHHNTALIPFRVLCYTWYDLTVNHSAKSLLIDLLGNIVMFMPIGFFVPLLWRVSGKSAVAVGFFTSLSIELTQLFLPRWTDIDDLFLNTLGTLLGWLLYHLMRRRFTERMDRFRLTIGRENK